MLRRTFAHLFPILFLTACHGQHQEFQSEHRFPQKPTGALPTYASIYNKIIVPQCLDCHSHKQGDGDGLKSADFDSYEETLKVVVPFQPSQSKIYTSLLAGKMPKEPGPLSTEDVQTISDWIAAGALNN